MLGQDCFPAVKQIVGCVQGIRVDTEDSTAVAHYSPHRGHQQKTCFQFGHVVKRDTCKLRVSNQDHAGLIGLVWRELHELCSGIPSFVHLELLQLACTHISKIVCDSQLWLLFSLVALVEVCFSFLI
jgi:hypothetical protein